MDLRCVADEGVAMALSYLDCGDLGRALCVSRRLFGVGRSNDWLWRLQLEEMWRLKWDPALGRRRWWKLWAAIRRLNGHEWVLTCGPSPPCAEGARFVRELSWYESCEFCASQEARRPLVNADLTSRADWYITFRSLDPSGGDEGRNLHRGVAFHADGIYEDGVFFLREASTCYWGLAEDSLRISTGGSHAVERLEDWSFRISNHLVVLSPRPRRDAERITDCVARDLTKRPDLNGKPCVVEGFCEASKRYHVFFPLSDDDDDDDDDDPEEEEEEESERGDGGTSALFSASPPPEDAFCGEETAPSSWRRRRRRRGSARGTARAAADEEPRPWRRVVRRQWPRLRVSGLALAARGVDHGPGTRCALRPRNVQLPSGARVRFQDGGHRLASGRVRSALDRPDGTFLYRVATSRVGAPRDASTVSSRAFKATTDVVQVDAEAALADL